MAVKSLSLEILKIGNASSCYVLDCDLQRILGLYMYASTTESITDSVVSVTSSIIKIAAEDLWKFNFRGTVRSYSALSFHQTTPYRSYFLAHSLSVFLISQVSEYDPFLLGFTFCSAPQLLLSIFYVALWIHRESKTL